MADIDKLTPLFTHVPHDTMRRLKIEALRSNKMMRDIVASALDAHLPKKIEIKVGAQRKAA